SGFDVDQPAIRRADRDLIRRYCNAAAGIFDKLKERRNYELSLLVTAACVGMCGEVSTGIVEHLWRLIENEEPGSPEYARLKFHAGTRFARAHPEVEKVRDTLNGLAEDFKVLRFDHLRERVGLATLLHEMDADDLVEQFKDRMDFQAAPDDRLRDEKALIWNLFNTGKRSAARSRIAEGYATAYGSYRDGFDYWTARY